MALPGSGTISASMINIELGRIGTASLSSNNASAGGYSRINSNSVSRPDKFNPDEYSEWYGYNHTAGGGGGGGNTGIENFGYNPDEGNSACMIDGNVDCNWISPTNNWWDATTFETGGRSAIRGWYSDTPWGGSTMRYWNRTGCTGQATLCEVVP